MTVTIHNRSILYLTFETRKELILTMCRAVEFYECASTQLRNRVFTFEQFIDYYMTPFAKLEYSWSGFNIPSRSLEHFFAKFDLSPREKKLQRAVRKLKSRPYYVIASCEGDISTMRHEFAHAYFDLTPDYKQNATALVHALPAVIRKAVTTQLLQWGYSEHVIVDEINAYIATSDMRYLQHKFTPRFTKTHVKPFVTLFNQVFSASVT